RGIDVPTITHVFNFGLPMKAEDYTHRIGRTGRAGRDGLAITLAEIRDRRRLADIEAYTQQAFNPLTVEGLEPTKFFPPVTGPKESGRGGRPGGRSRRVGRDGGRDGFARPRSGEGRGPRQFRPDANFERSDRSERGGRGHSVDRADRADRRDRGEA